MTPTIFGIIITCIGLFLMFRGGVMGMLLLLMGCSLMGGSAAMILNALGGSSVPPAQFALMFGLLRIVLPGSGRLRQAREALRANLFLVLYCTYGVFTGIFGPIMFRGVIGVVPMRGTVKLRSIFDTAPLEPSPQNITASVYLMGSALVGILAYVAMSEKNAARRYVRMGVLISWIHITLGVLGVAFHGTPFDQVIGFIRNANYTQHDQSIDGFVRITGIFPEPSAYASFGFGWFVFAFECWLRNVLPRRTGPVALAMGLVLFCSTSSTAYVALVLYGLIVGLRVMLFPQSLEARKGLVIAGAGLGAMILVSALAFLAPSLFDSVVTLLRRATIDKQQSESGMQRAFWAKVGFDAFFASNGFGIGPGSFRSSSLFAAILGSVGVVGAITFAGHLGRALKPLALSTYCGPRLGRRFGEEAMIGVAAAWAAIGVLLPASIAAPSCDPGLDFGVFTAVALALRGRSAASAAMAGTPYVGHPAPLRQPALSSS